MGLLKGGFMVEMSLLVQPIIVVGRSVELDEEGK